MTIDLILARRTDNNRTNMRRVSLVTLLTATGLAFTSQVSAAPEVTINQSMTGSTTIVEQYSNGQSAVITSTPSSISMREGMPYAVTQISNAPRYSVYQGSVPASRAVTTLPVNTLPLNTIPVSNQVTQVGVITTPVATVTNTLPITNPAVIVNNQVASTPIMTNQTVAVTSLDTLKLNPVFSAPDNVKSQTKIMKILKNSAGHELAVPANRINPGDVIEYHTTYTSTLAQPINDLNATVTLPNGIKVVSLNSPIPTLATTGGNSYQTIQQVGNSVVVQENYSGLKWNLVDLNANAPQTVVIRATVQ